MPICNVYFDNLSHDDFYRRISVKPKKSQLIVTPNVDFIVRANNDLDFNKKISNADISVCDSSIIYYLSKFLRIKLKSIITQVYKLLLFRFLLILSYAIF